MKKIIDLVKRYIVEISQADFVRLAIEEQADLSAFKEKPSLLTISGVFIICLSFVLGWPAVAGLGVLSIHLNEPLVVVIGGPLTYGLSHLVFIFGMYLSGGTYTLIFCRWLTRVSVERLLALGNGQQADIDLQK
nr:hypothetical protein [Desulfobulbaceae bacterium]